MKKKGHKPHKHYTGGKKADAAELSARLAPPEELKGIPVATKADNNNGGGAIRVDSNQISLSSDFAEEDRGAASTFRVEPIALVIILLSLAFIAFIAWQITLMPAPAK
ncbi:MAG: hypothetical protein WCD76_15695 [Pyrinomonadaceae bacterium]